MLRGRPIPCRPIVRRSFDFAFLSLCDLRLYQLASIHRGASISACSQQVPHVCNPIIRPDTQCRNMTLFFRIGDCLTNPCMQISRLTSSDTVSQSKEQVLCVPG